MHINAELVSCEALSECLSSVLLMVREKLLLGVC